MSMIYPTIYIYTFNEITSAAAALLSVYLRKKFQPSITLHLSSRENNNNQWRVKIWIIVYFSIHRLSSLDREKK